MKRRYLALGMLALALKGKPQAEDTTYRKRDLPKTDIGVLFSMYSQNGNHSAVTGGTGTEKLQVYAPGINLDFYRQKGIFSISAGTDVISSASTDKIDAVVSSASKVDLRNHADVHYTRKIGKKDIEVGVGTGFSMESDYLSFPVRGDLNYTTPSKMQKYHASVAAFFDDLRWGRLNPDYRRPVTVVYPAELRYKQWYDVYRRYSYNFKTGFEQVIGKRLIAAIYPELVIQKGLLATSFHRVYFTNDSVRVENLPKKRVRFPIGVKANYFAGSRTILKAGYEFYSDNFGIDAQGLDAEIAVKLSPLITLSPFVKFYAQTGSKYFRPYKTHTPNEIFYSSDYDLSKFNMVRAGIGFRWAPFNYMSAKTIFQEVNLRYTYLGRSDGLSAHMVSASFRFSKAIKNK